MLPPPPNAMRSASASTASASGSAPSEERQGLRRVTSTGCFIEPRFAPPRVDDRDRRCGVRLHDGDRRPPGAGHRGRACRARAVAAVIERTASARRLSRKGKRGASRCDPRHGDRGPSRRSAGGRGDGSRGGRRTNQDPPGARRRGVPGAVRGPGSGGPLPRAPAPCPPLYVVGPSADANDFDPMLGCSDLANLALQVNDPRDLVEEPGRRGNRRRAGCPSCGTLSPGRRTAGLRRRASPARTRGSAARSDGPAVTRSCRPPKTAAMRSK